jgi:hypothetical protein
VRARIPPWRYASNIALVSSICVPSSCLEESCDTLMDDDVGIDSKFVADRSIVEYRDRVVDSFKQRELTMMLLLL